jgi:hypothetical protein
MATDDILSNSSLEPRNRHERRATGRSSNPVLTDSSLHPKTAAVRQRASQPLPIEVMLMSTAQVAKALGVSAVTVFRYSKSGLLKPLKLGVGSARCPRRFRALDVMRLIEERLAAGAGATE